MIEHLRLRIDAKNLKNLLQEKSDLHKKRSRRYTDQLITLQKVADVRDPVWQEQLAMVNSKIKEELKKSDYFSFCAKYIIDSEHYELDKEDFKLLELF